MTHMTRVILIGVLAGAAWLTPRAIPLSQDTRVAIRVDAGEIVGPMTPIWAWFGYDEPNYTYMKDGSSSCRSWPRLSPVPGSCAGAQPADDR